MQTIRKTAGAYLREWRGKRHMSQLELANEAEISARHANVAPLLAGVDEALLKPPVNVLRRCVQPSF